MKSSFREVLWDQFGASIDMLENAIVMCPAEMWDTEKKFWYNAYHCLFYLDYYLTIEPEGFRPPEPFSLSEFDPSGALPERTYAKGELLTYVNACREKCRNLIAGLTDEILEKRWVNPYRDYSILEIIIYNLRHVQHHAAQLNLLLRQGIDEAPRWVSRSRVKLESSYTNN